MFAPTLNRGGEAIQAHRQVPARPARTEAIQAHRQVPARPARTGENCKRCLTVSSNICLTKNGVCVIINSLRKVGQKVSRYEADFTR